MTQHQTDYGDDEMPPLGWVPDPKKRRGNPERTIQVAVLRYLRAVCPPGTIVAAVKNEEQPRGDDPMQRARFVQAKIASGMLPGIPDLIVLLPASRTVFLEIKAPGGSLSIDQRTVHGRLRSIAHDVAVVRSIDEAREALRVWGIPTREAPHA